MHEHVKVMPFGVSCTEGKKKGWATKLGDHITQLASSFAPEGVGATQSRGKSHGMISNMRVWQMAELCAQIRDSCGEGVCQATFTKTPAVA